jgi:hypothetical protein
MAINQLYPEGRPSISANFARTKQIPPNLRYSRASTGTYVGSDGFIKTALVGEPRFDYDPLTGELKGLLIETAKTNFLGTIPNYNRFGMLNLGATLETPAPDGTNTARLYVADGSRDSPYIQPAISKSSFAPYTSLTVSSYVKVRSGFTGTNLRFSSDPGFDNNFVRVTFNPLSVSNATVTSGSLIARAEYVGNGWFRCSASYSGASVSSSGSLQLDVQIFGNSTSTTNGFYLWGEQIEYGFLPSSYIPTSGSTVTRAADTLSTITLPSSNSSTILVETESTINATPILSLNDGTTTNEIKLISHPLAGGSSVVDSFGSVATSAGGSRLYKTTNAISVSNTTANIVTDNAVSGITTISSSNLNQLRIGSTASGTAFNGTIKKLYYYNTASSIEKLKGLSKTRETTPLPPTSEPNLTMGVSITSANTTWNLRSTGTVNYDVDWGDGQIETAQTSNTKAHTYASPGIYKVVVKIRSGVFRPFYNNNVDAERIVSIFGTGTGWSFGTNLTGSFYRAANLINMEFINITGVTGLEDAWRGLSSLLKFPLIDTSSVTFLSRTWLGCSSLTSFPLIDTSKVTFFIETWRSCSSLTSFPLIDTSSLTSINSAWESCTKLVNFPLIDTSSVTQFSGAWFACSSLTTFPLIDTSKGTGFSNSWRNCSSLTTFPLIDTISATILVTAWSGCSNLTSFPLINTTKVTSFNQTWYNCSNLSSFPLINTSVGTNFNGTWYNCSKLTSFPLINTSNGINFGEAWRICSSLVSFPLLDTSKGTSFNITWRNCSSLTSFPSLNFSSATTFNEAWYFCTNLATFPANMFDTTGTLISNAFNNAFNACALTVTSIENILTSLVTNGQSNITLTLSGGTNATKSTWTTAANDAYDTLISRGWTITFRA